MGSAAQYQAYTFVVNQKTKYAANFHLADGKLGITNKMTSENFHSGYRYPLYSTIPIAGQQAIEFVFKGMHEYTCVGVATLAIKDEFNCWEKEESLCLGLGSPCFLSLNGKQLRTEWNLRAGDRLRLKADIPAGLLEWERVYPTIETLAKVCIPEKLAGKELFFVLHLCEVINIDISLKALPA